MITQNLHTRLARTKMVLLTESLDQVTPQMADGTAQIKMPWQVLSTNALKHIVKKQEMDR